MTKGQINEKKFKEINLIQNDKSNLPFINIVLATKRQDKTEGLPLKPVLVDSGCEICILTEKMLKEFKIPSSSIKRNCQNLNVVTSNQVSKNCILGMIYLDIWVVLDNGKKSMAKCPNTLFHVANSEIILEYPILGTNFLQQNKVILNYQNPDNCTITAQTMSNDHQLSI